MHIKRIFTIFFSILVLFCIFYFIKTDGKKISAIFYNSNNADKVSQTQSDAADSAMQIEKTQLCGIEEPAIIENTVMNDVYRLQFTFSNVQVSRQLDDKFKSRMLSRSDLESEFSDLVMSQDYTFLKDFYYLSVTVHVKNVSKGTTSFCVSSLRYVTNDNGSMSYIGLDSLNNIYNGSKYDSYECAFIETDNKQLLSRGYIEKFSAGDDLTYDACYIITDENLEKNNVYFAYSFGMRSEDALANKEQKYIKVDLGGKNEENTEK